MEEGDGQKTEEERRQFNMCTEVSSVSIITVPCEHKRTGQLFQKETITVCCAFICWAFKISNGVFWSVCIAAKCLGIQHQLWRDFFVVTNKDIDLVQSPATTMILQKAFTVQLCHLYRQRTHKQIRSPHRITNVSGQGNTWTCWNYSTNWGDKTAASAIRL